MANIKDLTSEAEAEALIDSDQPAWILKHSSACPISANARRHFEKFRNRDDALPAGIVTVQTDRAVSRHIAEKTGVTHQTPQALLVRNGEVLWHDSHGAITEDRLAEVQAEHADSA